METVGRRWADCLVIAWELFLISSYTKGELVSDVQTLSPFVSPL